MKDMRGRRKASVLMMALTMLMLVLAGCGGTESPGTETTADTDTNVSAAEKVITFKIGAVGPLTGPSAEAGRATKEGAEMAADEINARGGIDAGGKKVKLELLFEDSVSKPEVGVSMAEKLLGRDKVDLLVGEMFHSSVTMAIMELASNYPDIPFMSWQPVSSAITNKVKEDPTKYANFWKGNFDSTGYGRTVFATIKSLVDSGQIKATTKTLAFVVEDTDYGRSIANDAKALFEADGWKQVAMETVPLGHTDFYPQLSKLKGLNPDVMVTVFTALASGVSFSRQFQELDLATPQMAVYYPLRPEFIEQAGTASEGLVWTPLSFAPDVLVSQKPFADAIEAKYKVPATFDHAMGYDCLMIIANAIAEAGAIDGKQVNDALSKTDYKGLLGRYVFDALGHNIKDGPDFLPIPAAQIQNGKNVLIWPPSRATGSYLP